MQSNQQPQPSSGGLVTKRPYPSIFAPLPAPGSRNAIVDAIEAEVYKGRSVVFEYDIAKDVLVIRVLDNQSSFEANENIPMSNLSIPPTSASTYPGPKVARAIRNCGIELDKNIPSEENASAL